MTPPITIPILLLIGFCIITEAAHEICFKIAADNVPFTTAIRRPITWIGMSLWLIEITAWTVILENAPLSIAFPIMSLTYVAIVFAGALVLKEKVTKRHAIGALLISAGVACIGATGL